MNLDQYLPFSCSFWLVWGWRIPMVLGYLLGPNRPDAAKTPLTNAASRRLKMRA
jgi:hypothetical protein